MTETAGSSPFEGESVTITGGTGSFGSTMVRHLLARDVGRINILSRDEAKQDDMRSRLGDSRVKFFVGDVRDYESCWNAVTGADFVSHAAALKQVPSCEFFPDQAVKTNVTGSKNVIEASHRAGVRSVVCLSTDKAVYPVKVMGMSKALMEKTAQALGRNHPESPTTVSVTRAAGRRRMADVQRPHYQHRHQLLPIPQHQRAGPGGGRSGRRAPSLARGPAARPRR